MAESRTDVAYEQIKSAILSLRLQPGELITERALVALTGCGRTPVREAMHRLQRDGLLQIVPFRGAFVTEISAKDVTEIGQVRELLESFAAGLAATLARPEAIARLRATLDAIEPVSGVDPGQIFGADRAFHAAILEASGHRRAQEIIATLSDQIQRLRFVSLSHPQRAMEAHREHRQIAEAIAARDAKRATAAMRHHLVRSQQALLHVQGSTLLTASIVSPDERTA